MKIHYIYHSCFLVETKEYYFIFDYYKGTLPPLDTDKPILVFSSHFHADHYNPTIFFILKELGMKHIRGVLSKDIPSKKYPEDIPVTTVTHHRTYFPAAHVTVETLLSTDAGVAFLLTCPEGTIYHAGDLNDWVWEGETQQYNKQMTGSYRHEITRIKGKNIDTAFLVLDPRQEKHYAGGITFFLENTKTARVFPMHYWEQPEIIEKFKSEYPRFKPLIQDTETIR